MREGNLSINDVHDIKSRPGERIIACGEYNGKGSLEIYGLSARQDREEISSTRQEQAGAGWTSTFQNRATASRSKLLSVATHGARIVCSDAEGGVRFFERDCATPVRLWNINSYGPSSSSSTTTTNNNNATEAENEEGRTSLFGPSHSYGPQGTDVARKLLPVTSTAPHTNRTSAPDDILVWTGEHVGLMSFSPQPQPAAPSAEEDAQQMAERRYGEKMRSVLKRQADEVRWLRGLGL
jgi:hypothetical protein